MGAGSFSFYFVYLSVEFSRFKIYKRHGRLYTDDQPLYNPKSTFQLLSSRSRISESHSVLEKRQQINTLLKQNRVYRFWLVILDFHASIGLFCLEAQYIRRNNVIIGQVF